jgi:hypothetical protein
MKLFYNKLTDKFNQEETKDKYRLKGIKPIQFIDLYAGQDYMPDAFEATNYPALLVDWSIDYKVIPPIATLNFTLCYEQLRDSSNLGKNTAEALKTLDFIQITDEILKSIETPHTGKLNLISEGSKLDETVMDVYNLSYQCSYSGKLPFPKLPLIGGKVENLNDKAGLYDRLNE